MSLFNMSTRPKNRYLEEQKKNRLELERKLAKMPYEELYKQYMKEREAEESPYTSWGDSEPYKNELLKRPEYQAKLAEEARKYEERVNRNYLEKKAEEERIESNVMKNTTNLQKYTTKNIMTDFNPKRLPIVKLEEQEKDKFFQHCLITNDYVNDAVFAIASAAIYNPSYIRTSYKKETKWADYFIKMKMLPSLKNRLYANQYDWKGYHTKGGYTKGKYHNIKFPCIYEDNIDSHYFDKDKLDIYEKECKEYTNIDFSSIDFTFHIETAFMFLKDIEKYGYDANFQNYDVPEYELRAILRYRQERKITRDEFLDLSDYGKMLCLEFIIEEKFDLGIFMLSKPIYLDYSKVEKWAREQMNLFLKRRLGLGSVGNKHTTSNLAALNIPIEKRFDNDPYVNVELAKDKQSLSTDYMQYPYLYPLYYYDKDGRIIELPAYYLKKDPNSDFLNTNSFYTLKTMNYELSRSIIAYHTDDYRFKDIYVQSLAHLAGHNNTNFSIKDFFDYSEVYEEYMVNDQYKREQTLSEDKLFYNYYCPNYRKNSDPEYNVNYSNVLRDKEDFKTKEALEAFYDKVDKSYKRDYEEAQNYIKNITALQHNNEFDANLAEELIGKLNRMMENYDNGNYDGGMYCLQEIKDEIEKERLKFVAIEKYGEPEIEDDDIDFIEDTNASTDSIDNNEEEVKKIVEEIQNRYLYNKITPGLGEEIKYKLTNNLMNVDEALELLKRDKENYENVDEYNHNIE